MPPGPIRTKDESASRCHRALSHDRQLRIIKSTYTAIKTNTHQSAYTHQPGKRLEVQLHTQLCRVARLSNFKISLLFLRFSRFSSAMSRSIADELPIR